mgnify:CR=1 FL=1
MPYKKSKYRHYRQRNPKEFYKSSFRTVPLSHARYKGKKFKRYKNAKAIVGKYKKDKKWKIQSILIPKKK